MRNAAPARSARRPRAGSRRWRTGSHGPPARAARRAPVPRHSSGARRRRPRLSTGRSRTRRRAPPPRRAAVRRRCAMVDELPADDVGDRRRSRPVARRHAAQRDRHERVAAGRRDDSGRHPRRRRSVPAPAVTSATSSATASSSSGSRWTTGTPPASHSPTRSHSVGRSRSSSRRAATTIRLRWVGEARAQIVEHEPHVVVRPVDVVEQPHLRCDPLEAGEHTTNRRVRPRP